MEVETEVDAETASPADSTPQLVAIAKPKLAATDPASVQPTALPNPTPAAPQPSAQGPAPAQAAPGQAQIPQPIAEIAVTTRDERSPGQPLKRKEATVRTAGDITAAPLDPAAALDTVPAPDIAVAPAIAVALTPAAPKVTASMSDGGSAEPAGRTTTAHAAPDIAASPRHSVDHAATASRGDLPAPATPDPVAVAEPRVAAPIFSQTLDAAIARHAAPPYPPAQVEPATATVALREGRFGTDVGVAIARALDSGPEGMREALLIRLDPHHMGRVDVRMSFDDDGTLRAVVSADSPAALDMLRRESAQLDRSLADAGVRSDAQSLRFDAGGNGAGGQHRHGARPQLPMPQSGGADGFVGALDGGHSDYRSLRGSGHIDLMA
ncbi:flagellar hook-length control protein FliK [Novosphingobium kaempferiae]|uniref:flagellar hook-length control protein FliK n=1 Tax=Novosphingobium kaempferiae TaxID=2896849 RepID=UPI001E491851|nr:flagellar hook-length control protein FliK [Novosphingobium kaempferiae]